MWMSKRVYVVLALLRQEERSCPRLEFICRSCMQDVFLPYTLGYAPGARKRARPVLHAS